jgi:signal transduction histidine kinase
LAVKNSGPAISPDILANIFEPLNRGRETGREDDTGLGLGLYIANEIAKAHGGRISCTSEGTQTVFAVHLPRNASAVRP